MKDVELRVSYLIAALAFIGCGSSSPTDFNSPDQGGTENGGSAGAQQGGNSGAGQSGSAGAPQGGSGGSTAGAGGAGGALGGSAGSLQGGESGAGLGGSTPSTGGAIATGGSTGARGGSGGSGTVSYACGTLTCVQGRQLCVHTSPTMSGGPQMYQCLQYPDNCATVDCSCFCKGPQNDPCGPQSACTCSGDAGRITVECSPS
jgi:hypothetical protein